jgi:Tfp pilus assembly protein PilV
MLKKPALSQKSARGDTIVEVLIAIAVAGFAIGTSYALANKSLQNAITARERNEALNIIDNQIADLKNRYKGTYFNDPANFNKYFTAVSTLYGTPSSPYPSAKHHYCLVDGATNPQDDATWLPKDNTIANEPAAETLSNPTYANSCIVPTNSTNFYVDIAAQITSSSAGLADPTVYKVAVRWATIGGGANSQAVAYYRLGAPTTPVSGGPSGGNIIPPATTTVAAKFVVQQDPTLPSPPGEPIINIYYNGFFFKQQTFSSTHSNFCGSPWGADRVAGPTASPTNPAVFGPTEECNVYTYADLVDLPVDVASLKTIDFQFVNDNNSLHPPPNDVTNKDNNIIFLDVSIPGHTVFYRYYDVNGIIAGSGPANSTLNATPGEPISATNILWLNWSDCYAHFTVDATPYSNNLQCKPTSP